MTRTAPVPDDDLVDRFVFEQRVEREREQREAERAQEQIRANDERAQRMRMRPQAAEEKTKEPEELERDEACRAERDAQNAEQRALEAAIDEARRLNPRPSNERGGL